jgi:hypothetical protein
MSYNPVQPRFKCIPQGIVKKLFESIHPQPLSRALLLTNAEHFNQTETGPPMQKAFYMGAWIRSRGNNLEVGTVNILHRGRLQPLSTTLINLMSNQTAKMYHSELRQACVAWVISKLVWQPNLDLNAEDKKALVSSSNSESHEEGDIPSRYTKNRW